MPDRIAAVRITPIAFPDPPLLCQAGTHEPTALRSVVQVETAHGLVGLGEGHGASATLRAMTTAATALTDGDPADGPALLAAARAAVLAAGGTDHLADRALAPLEVALLDVLGRIRDEPVHAMLGQKRRDRVEFAGYLFYKWGEHLEPQPDGTDPWGPALDPAGIVAQAQRMHALHGFTSYKLKAGVFAPDEEAAAIRALAEAMPHSPLRIDPNGQWTLATSLRIAEELDGLLEYLEDPTIGTDAMAEVTRRSPMPTATNMLNEDHAQHLALFATAADARTADIALIDHHIVGGLAPAADLARRAIDAGIGVAMHSNSHLGITLRAMTQLASTVAEIHACDTHYPWNSDYDVVVGGPLEFVDGALEVSDAPGLGCELDTDLLAAAHQRYLERPTQDRDDASYRRRVEAGFTGARASW